MDKVAAFVRGRPKQPLDAFMRQSNAVIDHDAVAQLARIKAPTQVTFGRHDQVTSLRFADALTNGINGSELLVFETCAHAPIYQSTAEFNEKTLSFLNRHTG
jgi:proline iminopeptidase